MHVHVAVLHMGWIRWELSAWLLWVAATERRMLVSIKYYGADPQGRPIASNRNRIVRDRPPGADKVLMLDSDTVPPKNLLDIALMEHDIVFCPSPIWRAGRVISNVKPLEGSTVDVGRDEVIEVAAGGGGAFCVSCAVLDALPGAFMDRYDADGVTTMTEDYIFCDAARSAGYRIYAALGYPIGHVKEINIATIP